VDQAAQIKSKIKKIRRWRTFAIFAVLCVFARNIFRLVNDRVDELGSRKDAKNREDRKGTPSSNFLYLTFNLSCLIGSE
jgi:hypothetical protein